MEALPFTASLATTSTASVSAVATPAAADLARPRAPPIARRRSLASAATHPAPRPARPERPAPRTISSFPLPLSLIADSGS